MPERVGNLHLCHVTLVRGNQEADSEGGGLLGLGTKGCGRSSAFLLFKLFEIMFLFHAYLKPSMESCACRPGKPSGASTSSKLAPE